MHQTGGDKYAGMADGSVRFLSKNIDLNLVLLPMASRATGETIAGD